MLQHYEGYYKYELGELFRDSPHHGKLTGRYNLVSGIREDDAPVYTKVDPNSGREMYIFRREGGRQSIIL